MERDSRETLGSCPYLNLLSTPPQEMQNKLAFSYLPLKQLNCAQSLNGTLTTCDFPDMESPCLRPETQFPCYLLNGRSDVSTELLHSLLMPFIKQQFHLISDGLLKVTLSHGT